MELHRVYITKLKVSGPSIWYAHCDFNSTFFHRYYDSFEAAIKDGDDHARNGDHESRYCGKCKNYMPTCDDMCLYCEADT